MIGLLGLVVGLGAMVWLVAATLFRGPRQWAAWVALVGLALFFGNLMVPPSKESKEATPAPYTAMRMGDLQFGLHRTWETLLYRSSLRLPRMPTPPTAASTMPRPKAPHGR